MRNLKKKAAINKNNAAINKNKINKSAADIKKSNDEKPSKMFNSTNINKRKWDEEQTCMLGISDGYLYGINLLDNENTIKNLMDKNQDVPKKSDKHKASKVKDILKDMLSGVVSNKDIPKLFERLTEIGKVAIENPASNNILKNTSLNIKDVLSGLISEDDMSKLLETINEVQKIELEKELKKQKENKENNESFNPLDYYSKENKSKSKNIVLNIDVSKIDSLTINIS